MKIDYSIFCQKTAIDRFIFAIKNGYFKEGHELLEDDWREFKKQGEKEKALVLKGFINASTALALFHIKKNEDGYKRVWLVFEKYIDLLEKVELDEKEKFFEAKEILIKEKNKIETK